MTKYPAHLKTLTTYFKKLPGVGSKTAERFSFHLLDWPESELNNFATHLLTLKEKLTTCPTCGCIEEENLCLFCSSTTRDPSSLCIVSNPKDVYPIEDTHVFNGHYHVLGGLISPLDGRSAQDLNTQKLKERIDQFKIKDVILALDSTLEGDATALYLKQELQSPDLRILRPAMGIPMGSSLDYVDGGTLARALLGRQNF